MTARDVIARVEAMGGVLLADNDKIRLRVPGDVPSDLKESIKEHKAEILDLLCPHAPGCTHSIEGLIAEYQRVGKVRIEYKNGAVHLVATQEIARAIADGTVYTITEFSQLVRLSNEEIRQVHDFKAIGGNGGSVQLEEFS